PQPVVAVVGLREAHRREAELPEGPGEDLGDAVHVVALVGPAVLVDQRLEEADDLRLPRVEPLEQRRTHQSGPPPPLPPSNVSMTAQRAPSGQTHMEGLLSGTFPQE